MSTSDSDNSTSRPVESRNAGTGNAGTSPAASGKVTLEASGGVNLDTVRDIAQTGVDVISVGALTHSAPNFDIGLDEA